MASGIIIAGVLIRAFKASFSCTGIIFISMTYTSVVVRSPGAGHGKEVVIK